MGQLPKIKTIKKTQKDRLKSIRSFQRFVNKLETEKEERKKRRRNKIFILVFIIIVGLFVLGLCSSVSPSPRL